MVISGPILHEPKDLSALPYMQKSISQTFNYFNCFSVMPYKSSKHLKLHI